MGLLLKDMRVWYGYSKLTKKAVRKRELAIYYENYFSYRNEEWVSKRMHVVHERKQTNGEIEDGKHNNRMFTKYGFKIDEKPYNGDIDKVLNANSQADKNNVSTKERTEIQKKLRAEYFSYYEIEEKPVGQLKLNI